MKPQHQPYGVYERFLKRPLDFLCALAALVVLSPLMLGLIFAGAIAMKGNPFFTQLRPGREEKIFRLIKFRTMSNARDANGNLLPDSQRLNRYGRVLRATSLDELPELFNILTGDMAVVGPRPQLVRDLLFMNDEQRRRHTVRPGLSGWAQVNGRNNITWEEKFSLDLEYLDRGITFRGDAAIIYRTVLKVLCRSDVAREGTETDIDFGDWLLKNGSIDRQIYEEKQLAAQELISTRR